MSKSRRLDWKEPARFLTLLDFASKPTTKVGWALRIVVTIVALAIAGRKTAELVRPLVTARPPPFVPHEPFEDDRFGLPERTRREIFAEIAAAEVAERKRAAAANTWDGHLWSREDDRGHYERLKLRELAARYNASLSQMYLVLDEGIRNKWPGPDGEPLPATTPPWNARSTW